MTVQIQVSVSDAAYRALVAQAERCGTRVPKLVAAAVEASVLPQKLLRTETRRVETETRVRELHARGWSDRRIANDVRLSHVYVGRIRRRLGLAPNYKPIGDDRSVDHPEEGERWAS